MGKSEILMLLAGVALSIMLAMVAIPMFSSGSEMADRQQVQQELMSIKSSIPLIKALEGSEAGSIKAENIKKHLDGFTVAGDVLTGTKNSNLATFTITDSTDLATDNTVEVLVTALAGGDVDLTKLSRLESICDAGINTKGTFAANTDADELTCFIKR